jgi:PAS domain S-box-containing protein
MAYVVEGELFGTSLIGVKKDQPDPSFKLMRAFANMAGVSLRRRRAERALARSEEKYRGLVDNAGAGVVTADVEANITFANDALCGMIGYSQDELLGTPFIDLLHPEDAGNIMDLFIGALRDEARATELEFRVRHKDGHYIHFYTSPTLSYDNGEISGFNGIMFDVSERKRAEEALAREKKFSDYIIDSVPGTFYVYDRTGHLVRWNKEEEELIGLPAEQIPQVDGLTFFHEEDREAVARKMAEVFEKGHAEMEARLVRPDKEVRNFFITGRKMEVGDSVFLVGSGIDVTDRKKAEEALKRSEERFRLLAENAKDMIYRVRLAPKQAVEYVSPSALALTGYAPEEFYADPTLGSGLFTFEHHKEPVGAAPSKETLGRPVTMRWKRKDGGSVWMELVNHPVLNAAGKVVAVEGVARDVTERKQVEDALRESEEKFRDLAEQSPNMIFINVKGRVVYANRRCEELTGYTRDEFYSPDFDFMKIAAPEHRALVAEKYGAHLSGREVSPYEYSIITKAGRRIDAILSTKLITYGGERALLGTITDITERKKAEKALRESEDKFRRLFESSPEGILMFDLEGSLVDINEAGLKLLGLARAESVGKHFLELPGNIKADEKRYMELFKKFLSGEPVSPLETQMISPDGVRWEEVYPAILYKDGEPQAIQVIIRDITERKEADEKIHASLKEKEVLLKEIHHRVKNNLQIIHSLLNMQSRRVKDRRVLDALRESQNRVRTMALIHERLYRSTDLSEIDFKEYIDRLVGELYLSYGVNADQIRLELDLRDVKLGIDNAIPCGFIVNELVSNSLKHGFPDNSRGKLRISLGSEKDGTIRLGVGDSGVGLPQGLDFHKTETLGLQLVCTLVDQLRGSVELDRSWGTEFVIRFNPTKTEGC